jgi:hypothetical protein
VLAFHPRLVPVHFPLPLRFGAIAALCLMKSMMTLNRHTLSRCSLLALLLQPVGCGSDDEASGGRVGDACSPDGAAACEAGLACDPRADGTAYVCGEQAVIRGRVADALEGNALADGRVIVLGADGSPASDVAYTDDDGGYSAVATAPRNADGTLAETAQWTLAVSAQGYLPFPAGPRPALPIFASQAEGGVIQGPSTDVALLPRENPDAYAYQISGTIASASPGGTLMIAEGGEGVAPTAIASRSGEFTIFNVPSGTFELAGYKRGQQLERTTITVRDASVEGALLEPSDVPLGGVSGNVNIVNAPGGSLTSVVLVPESVFDERLERGAIPLGLRAPGQPEAPSVNGAFAFDQVPQGDYVVLAAFENDGLVRDPDTSIGGTTIQRVTVDSGQSVVMSQSFKITEHLAIIGPGADTPEPVSGPFSFSWSDDSSEDRYELELYTAIGDLIWEQRAIPSGQGDRVELDYAGPALVPGMVYQFRVTSFRDRSGGTTAISKSEDLRGVFEFRPE